MILTGSEIVAAREHGEIIIEPFEQHLVNPNSYNYRLAPRLLLPHGEEYPDDEQALEIPGDGLVLEPQRLYLASTFEILGSRSYAMSLIGRSSIGRLGLFLQVSANLGHVGSAHAWTLELIAAKPIRLYPRMRIGQISFWMCKGEAVPYSAGYSRFNVATPSKWRSGKEVGK
jgi:dCTP deaminase